MIPTPPLEEAITPGFLRKSYEVDRFSFGNADADTVICLIGSCRIVPYLNFLRVYNHFSGNPFEILCFDPIEMWTPGTPRAEGVNTRLAMYRFFKVDWLICEHVGNCGVLNTTTESEENIFDSLGCGPRHVAIRLPNWHAVHIYDTETAGFDPVYGSLPDDLRIQKLREQAVEHKERFLGYCRMSSFPELEQWVSENWLTIRLGWTNSHITMAFARKVFSLIARVMGIEITPEMEKHTHFNDDMFLPGHTVLEPVDYKANGWKF